MNFNDDNILLIALRERNEKAFDMIFQKYFKSIYSFVYQTCKQAEDAEDLTQEIFVKLWENSRTVPIKSLKSYLFTLARGIVVDWRRKRINQLVFEKLDEKHEFFMSISEQDDQVSKEELLSVIRRIAQTIPKRRQEVYRLRWIEGLSRKEIAQRMGITVTTVDIHLRKVLEYLRVCVFKIAGYK
jgi:RNA polymerase sigma-70 factor (ECF subfamily)